MKRFCALFLLLAAFLIPATADTETMSPSGDGYVFSDGWIYFRAVSGDDYALCRMREDLTGLEKLSDSRGYHLSVAGDALYFMADGRIRRVGTEGEGKSARPTDDEWGGALISTGDYLYVARTTASCATGRTLKKVVQPVRKTDIPSRSSTDGFTCGFGRHREIQPNVYRVRTDGSERGKWYEAPGPAA